MNQTRAKDFVTLLNCFLLFEIDVVIASGGQRSGPKAALHMGARKRGPHFHVRRAATLPGSSQAGRFSTETINPLIILLFA